MALLALLAHRAPVAPGSRAATGAARRARDPGELHRLVLLPPRRSRRSVQWQRAYPGAARSRSAVLVVRGAPAVTSPRGSAATTGRHGCATVADGRRSALWKAERTQPNVPRRPGRAEAASGSTTCPTSPECRPGRSAPRISTKAAADERRRVRPGALYRDEVRLLARCSPGEKARLAVRRRSRMLWSPLLSVAAERPGAAGAGRPLAAHGGCGVRPRSALRARPLGARSSATAPAFVALAAVLLGLQHADGDGLRGACAIRAPWDFVLARSRPSPLERAWRSFGAGVRRPPRERARRAAPPA